MLPFENWPARCHNYSMTDRHVAIFCLTDRHVTIWELTGTLPFENWPARCHILWLTGTLPFENWPARCHTLWLTGTGTLPYSVWLTGMLPFKNWPACCHIPWLTSTLPYSIWLTGMLPFENDRHIAISVDRHVAIYPIYDWPAHVAIFCMTNQHNVAMSYQMQKRLNVWNINWNKLVNVIE